MTLKSLLVFFSLYAVIVAESITLYPRADASFGDAMTASYSTTVNRPDCDTITVCNYTC